MLQNRDQLNRLTSSNQTIAQSLLWSGGQKSINNSLLRFQKVIDDDYHSQISGDLALHKEKFKPCKRTYSLELDGLNLNVSDKSSLFKSSIESSSEAKRKRGFADEEIKTTNISQVKCIATDHFAELDDHQITTLLMRDDFSDEDLEFVRYALWSWTHFKDFDDDRLKKIMGDIPITIYPTGGHEVPFTYRSTNWDGKGTFISMFSCSNHNPVNMYSEKMMEAALSYPHLQASDLQAILDNYILGVGDLEGDNNGYKFNSQKWRDAIFTSDLFLQSGCLEFLNEYSQEYLNEDAEENSRVPIDTFLSKDAALKVYKTIVSQSDRKKLKRDIDNLMKRPEILVHIPLHLKLNLPELTA